MRSSERVLAAADRGRLFIIGSVKYIHSAPVWLGYSMSQAYLLRLIDNELHVCMYMNVYNIFIYMYMYLVIIQEDKNTSFLGLNNDITSMKV